MVMGPIHIAWYLLVKFLLCVLETIYSADRMPRTSEEGMLSPGDNNYSTDQEVNTAATLLGHFWLLMLLNQRRREFPV